MEIPKSSCSNEVDESELSNEQMGILLHYFGIDSSDSLESIQQGVNALAFLQRS